ncbi:MAG: hypothetical protein ACREDT_05260 [Methylocella sp.]
MIAIGGEITGKSPGAASVSAPREWYRRLAKRHVPREGIRIEVPGPFPGRARAPSFVQHRQIRVDLVIAVDNFDRK